MGEWVQRQGGMGLDNIKVCSFNKNGEQVRGLAATRDFSPSSAAEPLFSIPGNLILHWQHPTVLSSPFARQSDISPYDSMLFFLAAERRKVVSGVQSFWTPYFRTLPTPEEF